MAAAGLALAGALSAASDASAFDWSVTAHVNWVEASYMPTRIVLTIDQAAGSCPSGSLLVWTSTGSDSTQLSAQAEAILSLFMTAKVSGQPVTIFGINSGCNIQFVHLGVG